MLILRATKRLLDRLGPPTLGEGDQSSTLLGQWYATALRWRPQVALLVNETTLLPVLMPLAPAATLPARAGEQITTVLAAHGVPGPIIAAERRQMRQWRTAVTANRSVVGIMNEFAFLADAWRAGHRDLLELSLRLAATHPAARCTQRTADPTARYTPTCAPSSSDARTVAGWRPMSHVSMIVRRLRRLLLHTAP